MCTCLYMLFVAFRVMKVSCSAFACGEAWRGSGGALLTIALAYLEIPIGNVYTSVLNIALLRTLKPTASFFGVYFYVP